MATLARCCKPAATRAACLHTNPTFVYAPCIPPYTLHLVPATPTDELASARLELERVRTGATDAAAQARALVSSLSSQLRGTRARLVAAEAAAKKHMDALQARQQELEGANAQIKVGLVRAPQAPGAPICTPAKALD